MTEKEHGHAEGGQHDRLCDPAGQHHAHGLADDQCQDERRKRPDHRKPLGPDGPRRLIRRQTPGQDQAIDHHPRIPRRGHEERRVEHRKRTDEKHAAGPVAEHRGVHGTQRAHHFPAAGPQAEPAERGGAEEVEADRDGRVDDHRSPGIELHHLQPATGAGGPGRRVVTRSHRLAVSLFQAPVGIDHQLARPHTDDADRGQRRHQWRPAAHRGRKRRDQSTDDFTRRDRPGRVTLQHHKRQQCDERERSDEQDRHPLDETVATDAQEHGGDHAHDDGPDRFIRGRRQCVHRPGDIPEPGVDRIGLRGISTPPDRRLRHSHVGCLVVQTVPLAAGRRDRQAAGERLRHTGEDTPLLHDDERRHQHPPPVDPSHA